MKLFLLGGTGQTGSIVLGQALDRGHRVTAFVRSPDKIKRRHENLKVINGNILSSQQMSIVMLGHDVVVSCLGGNDNDKTTTITDMTKVIVGSMKQAKVKKIVNISSAGIHNEFSFITNLIVRLFYKHVIADHRLAAEAIISSDLNYTIARPLSLIDGQLTKEYRLKSKGVPRGGKNISREDLAHFLLEAVESDQYINETVGIAY